jgi:hypothetical protein
LNLGGDYFLVFANIDNRPSIPQYGFAVTHGVNKRNAAITPFLMRRNEKAEEGKYFTDPFKATRMRIVRDSKQPVVSLLCFSLEQRFPNCGTPAPIGIKVPSQRYH